MIWFSLFVWFNQTNETDQINKRDQSGRGVGSLLGPGPSLPPPVSIVSLESAIRACSRSFMNHAGKFISFGGPAGQISVIHRNWWSKSGGFPSDDSFTHSPHACFSQSRKLKSSPPRSSDRPPSSFFFATRSPSFQWSTPALLPGWFLPSPNTSENEPHGVKRVWFLTPTTLK